MVDIIDLTGEEGKVHKPSKRSNRRPSGRTAGRPRALGGSIDHDNDVEVVAVHQRPAKRRRRSRRSDDMEILEARVLTPQERFKRIQETHLRGGTVAEHGPSDEGFVTFPSQPSMLETFYNNAFHFPRNTGEPTLEERVFEQALAHSMDDTHRRQNLSVSMLALPKPPPEPAPGFSHQLGAKGELSVCTRCGMPLGEGLADDNGPETRVQLSRRIFIRGCGHGYCGICTMSMPQLAKKDAQCPVTRCRSMRSRIKQRFREIFI